MSISTQWPKGDQATKILHPKYFAIRRGWFWTTKKLKSIIGGLTDATGRSSERLFPGIAFGELERTMRLNSDRKIILNSRGINWPAENIRSGPIQPKADGN